MKVSVAFEGGAELAQALDRLSVRISKSIMRDALLEAGEPMRRTAARFAPYEPGAPDLKANIGIAAIRGDDMATVAIGPTRGFFYGLFQEYGTSRHGAQPFMRPAFDMEAPRALDLLGRALWRELAGRGVSRRVTTVVSVQSVGRLR